MWTLGFDTTASTVSVALLRDSALVCTYSASSKTTHSTTLLPVIEQLLEAASIMVSDLDLISCSAGPGSFTGVRIGCATAKGLAAPFNIPCVGVSAMEAMAASFKDIECIVCPALNARRGNVYTAVFHSDGNGSVTRLTDDDLLPIADIPSLITDAAKQAGLASLTVYIAGDSVREISDADPDGRIKEAPALLKDPSGYGAALAGLKYFIENGCDTSLFSEGRLAPIYLRKSQAEREKEERAEKK